MHDGIIASLMSRDGICTFEGQKGFRSVDGHGGNVSLSQLQRKTIAGTSFLKVKSVCPMPSDSLL